MPGLLLVVLAALAVAYSVPLQPIGCNQTAHYGLVQALADGTPRIDRYHQETCDKSFIDGHYYSAKAPGLAFATEPWYAFLDAAGLVPTNPRLTSAFPEAMLALPRRVSWQLHLWSVMLPALALVLLVGLAAERLERGTGAAVAATVGLGTLVLPFATDYFAHVLSAALGFAAFWVLSRWGRGVRPASVAGLLVGLAIVVEFPLALVAAALGLLVLAAGRLRPVLAYAAGVLVGALPVFAFNAWAFGSPFELSYENAVIDPGRTGHDVVGANESGFFGVGVPSARVALELLFSPKGLLTLTPVLVLGLAGAVLLYRRGQRAEGLLVGGLPVAFLLYNAAYATPFGGFVPGPRFLIPAIPFLALGLAPLFLRRRIATTSLAIVSMGAMVVATAAEPMLGEDDTRLWLRRWEDGEFTQTVVTLAGDGNGWLAVAPFLVAAVVAALAGLGGAPADVRRPDVVLAAAVLAGWLVLLTAAPNLLQTDRLADETWGAVAVAALAGAVALSAVAGRYAVLALAPLLVLFVPGRADHSKQALLLALLALAGALAAALYERKRTVIRPS